MIQELNGQVVYVKSDDKMNEVGEIVTVYDPPPLFNK